MLADVAAAGVDHVFMADHVSFRNGSGTDGFVEIAGLSQLHPSMGVMISIYLLPLRHPVPVARQLATVNRLAPGRVLFGVGIGGEDRHEIEVCGVDPATRGRRMNESLGVLRGLMRGEEVTFHGEFFDLDQALIRPAIQPPIPIIVGGRSDAALVRAGQLGDGWIGAWCSVRRFTQALGVIDEAAAQAERVDVTWQHGYQPWVGVADTRDEARRRVAAAMEAFYKVPFASFEKYTPYGTPDEVASELTPYVQAGCRLMNFKVVAGDDADAIAATGEIGAALRAVAAA
ncbi:MAG: LLM class flavin-dependent oxidoreductase [Pseudomonadales bacterium]|nr:LLM class flavin-dependent oxidoreductase [Pseudomonadales bacterium]NIX09659.1 LLM class flavin-dependent oxidoreductase [Pseudomonadales bacterium]